MVLTNHHVVRNAIDKTISPTRLSCLFDLKYAENAGALERERVSLADGDEWTLGSSPHSNHDVEIDPKSGVPGADELDFALLRLAKPAGATARRRFPERQPAQLDPDRPASRSISLT